MSFQAYLDNIETKTGKTPNDFIAMAKEKGYTDPAIKTGVIINWLKTDFNLGHGHAMAMAHVIKNGTEDKEIGSPGFHKEEAKTAKLDGKDKK